jgi:hypothetical protein
VQSGRNLSTFQRYVLGPSSGRSSIIARMMKAAVRTF